MLDLQKIKTYVLHYTKLVERRQYMENFTKSLNLDVEWITELDQEELVGDVLDSYYRPNEQDWITKVKDLWDINQHGFRNLRPSEISLTAKHVEAMRRISECDDDFGLILEDDVITTRNFKQLLNEYYAETPDDWDVIFIGNGYGINVPRQKLVNGKRVYLADHPASRCTEAMLVKKSAAKKLYKSMKPFTMVCDWEYGWQFYSLDMKVYWFEPALITQASHALQLNTIPNIPEYFKSTLR